MARELKGAEIFSAGTWNGLTFTESDLDVIESAFASLGLAGRVPLKLGHNEDQPVTDGQPALGWVQRVWREGEKLFADFADLPTVVYDAIKSKAYKFVSVELLQDAHHGGIDFPWVLSAVSLLGADIPAVSNLRELAALTMTRTGLRFANRQTFTREIQTSGVKKMADDNAAVLEQLRAAQETITRMTTESAAIKAAHDKLIADGKAEKAASIRSQIEAKFKNAVESKRLLPAARERYFKWHVPKDVERVIELDLADVDAYIEENKINMSSDSNSQRMNPTLRNDDEDGKSPDVVVMGRVKKFMQTTGEKDYAKATVSILRDDPDLAETYRSMPGSVYGSGK